MDSILQELIAGDGDNITNVLEKVCQINVQKYVFPELNQCNYRHKLWETLYTTAVNQKHDNLHKLCLSFVRILSRDKTDLNEVVTEKWIVLIFYHAGFKGGKDVNNESNNETALEALKCLCNIIFNSNVGRLLCCKNGILESIIYRMDKVSKEVQYFDMKILFLITVLCDHVRLTLKRDLNGLRRLTQLLKTTLKKISNRESECYMNLTCEILKCLFNLTINLHDKTEEDEEDAYIELVTVSRNFLLIMVQDQDKLEINNHVINLLTNLPDGCLVALIQPINSGQMVIKETQINDQNFSAVYEILKFLKNRLSSNITVESQHEMLSPVLTILVKLSTSNRSIRKYLRHQVLPPLSDVHNRPEQGSTLRNCLCRLLTTPVTQVRDLTAEFLFKLCKENVERMIKYTGYGNAAGMFASKGLLKGKSYNSSNYSSESEQSETEEYTEYKHDINPVVGCCQPKKIPAMHNMSEEQKEYEAMKLVELMDNLTNQGIVKPCRINDDGCLEPVDHIIQLQESLPKQQIYMDSDSEQN